MPGAASAQAPENFAAGDAGHEKVERNALRGLLSPGEIKAIYFGNWQRDMSQTIAPMLYDPRLASRLPAGGPRRMADLIFLIVDVLAEADFGRRQPGAPATLNRLRFGTYRWEEHIDNPRNYGRAISAATYLPEPQSDQFTVPDSFPVLWREDSQGRLGFLRGAMSYIQMQLERALTTPRIQALEHFGNAMHTVEDFFAHSNFIELALNELDQRVDPLTGTSGGRPITDRLGRWRLTTGVFLPNDTVVSLQKLFLHHLTVAPSEKAQRVNAVLIERLVGESLAKVYLTLMEAWNRTPIAFVQEKIQSVVFAPLKAAISQMLHPLAEYAGRFTGREIFDGFVGNQPAKIVETSHSLVAKDDNVHVHHGIACALAQKAVREHFQEMQRCWAGRITDYGATRLFGLTDALFNHPRTNRAWWGEFFQPGRSRPTPPAPGRSGLRRGAQGPPVAEMQGKLNDWLFTTPRASLALLIPDGIFGPRTEAAVVAFQRARGLSATGIIDGQTAAALRAVPGSGRAQPSPPGPIPAGTPGQKFTANPNEVGTRRTTPTAREVVDMLRREWPELNENGARTLTAQFMGETGGGRFCFNWNLGNVKEPSGKLPHMYLRGVWEVLSPGAAQTCLSRGGGRARIASDAEVKTKGWSRPAGKVVVVFEPPHDACRFRAYASLRDGAQRWLGHHRRIAAQNSGYLQAVNAGDTRAVAAALKRARYYTAGEEDYARLMARQKAVIDRTLG